MALIQCPECQQAISDAAAACPKCGHPIANDTIAQKGTVLTMQQTAKRYKGRQLLGGAMIALSVVLIMAEARGIGVAFGALGLLLYLSARFGAWWNHG